jgi:NAD(P)-dependent dehydrogenase (short-subunit alcohol dehydrogenase family)
MTSKLSGKVALVTGGSAGIGLGIAKRFAEEGARVFITGRRQSELDKAVTAIGGGATAVQSDISNLDDLDRIFATIKDKAGRIDVLAVNAGYYEFGTFGEITEEHFDRTFNTNVRGLLFTVQKALPLLRGPASVILTGSIASIKGFPSVSVYNASKAAVRSFARSWIADLKGRAIRIKVLSPGHVETPGPVRPDVGGAESGGRGSGPIGPDRDAQRCGQSCGVPRFRRQRLHHRHRTLRRWRCCADLRNAVSVALAAVTLQSGEARHEQPKNPLWPLV